MKKLKFLLILCITGLGGYAQNCNPILDSATIVIKNDTTISVANLGSVLICPGVVVNCTSNSSTYNFYLEEGAELHLDSINSYGYDSVWVKNPGFFDSNHTQYHSVLYESGATLTDTMPHLGANAMCNSITYDYSLMPGGVSGCSVTNIAEKIPSDIFNIYPNPSNEVVFINTSFKQYEVWLFNMLGETMWQARNATQIDLNYPTGVYFVKVAANGKTITKKLIVR